jgi:hypothetical protein
MDQQLPVQANKAGVSEALEDVLKEQDKDEFSLSNSLKELGAYTMPIVSFVIFLVILFAGIIPGFNDIGTNNIKISSLQQEYQAAEQRIATLDQIRSEESKYRTVINKINEVIPSSMTEVANFASRIDQSLKTNTLSSDEIKTGEAELLPMSTNETAGSIALGIQDTIIQLGKMPLRQVPINLKTSGRFGDTKNFFKTLYSGKDFFVVGKMDLQSSIDLLLTATDKWDGELELTKYQFSEKDYNSETVYLNVAETQPPNQDVIDFVTTKYLTPQP